MRFISTKTHGILDYTVGTFLIFSPWIFGFANGGAAQYVPIIIGIMVIIMSFVTNYEMGAIKSLSMSTHLTIDVVIGIFLAISPWLFGFANIVYWPHLIFGLFSISAGLFTKKVPGSYDVPIHGHG